MISIPPAPFFAVFCDHYWNELAASSLADVIVHLRKLARRRLVLLAVTSDVEKCGAAVVSSSIIERGRR